MVNCGIEGSDFIADCWDNGVGSDKLEAVLSAVSASIWSWIELPYGEGLVEEVLDLEFIGGVVDAVGSENLNISVLENGFGLH